MSGMMLLMAIGWLVVVGAVAAGIWWLLKRRRHAGDAARSMSSVSGTPAARSVGRNSRTGVATSLPERSGRRPLRPIVRPISRSTSAREPPPSLPRR